MIGAGLSPAPSLVSQYNRVASECTKLSEHDDVRMTCQERLFKALRVVYHLQ